MLQLISINVRKIRNFILCEMHVVKKRTRNVKSSMLYIFKCLRSIFVLCNTYFLHSVYLSMKHEYVHSSSTPLKTIPLLHQIL